MKGYVIKGVYRDTSYSSHGDLIKSKDSYDNKVYLDKTKAEGKIEEYKLLEKSNGIHENFILDEIDVVEWNAKSIYK